MNNISRYETEIATSASPNDKLLFSFVSKGENDINKIIVYNRIITGIEVPDRGNISGFNLGFGDYVEGNRDIDDLVTTNNGDIWRVFNTVLSTIPVFFNQYPDHFVFVTGSNDVRKKLYCHFVSKNLETYSDQYSFYGLVGITKNFVPFEPKKNYNGVLFLLK